MAGAWPSSDPIHNSQRPLNKRAAQTRQTRLGGMHFQHPKGPETVSLVKSSDGEVLEDDEEKRGFQSPNIQAPSNG